MPFLLFSGSGLHIFVIVYMRFKGNQTDFNQQKRGEMTHYTLKMSFCIPTIERFREILQVRKFVVEVAFSISQ